MEIKGDEREEDAEHGWEKKEWKVSKGESEDMLS